MAAMERGIHFYTQKPLTHDIWQSRTLAKRNHCTDYHPKKWRTFYDFGLGMMSGDRGCHTLDTPVWALDLDPPTVVECRDRKDSLGGVIPAASRIEYHFPAKGDCGPVTLYWFDGPQVGRKVGRIDKFGAEQAAHLGRAC